MAQLHFTEGVVLIGGIHVCGICLCGVHMRGVCAWMCVVVGVCVYIHVCCI